ncbi:MAG: aldehyde dehydrogenase family protein [Pseudobdellovibrionaceae bacterium]
MNNEPRPTHFFTTSPFDDAPLKKYDFADSQQVQDQLQTLHRSFDTWRQSPLAQRSALLKKWSQALKDHSAELAQLVHSEMGKPLAEAKAEIIKSATACDYYSQHGPQFLQSQKIDSDYAESWVSYQPLGIVFILMPWNFPIWQVLRCAAPAIMAGNTVLLKPAEITAGSQMLLTQILQEASQPEPIFSALLMDHTTAAQVIADRRVQGVSFTGSANGGRQVAQLAGQNLKKSVLELGGSDPYIVLADADVAHAAKVCAQARMVNNGQSCVAAKRFLLSHSIAESFIAAFLQQMQSYPQAPLAHKKFRDQLHQQVIRLQEAGGEILLGGQIPQGPGAFYPPTAIQFTDHPKILQNEELFGPAAIVCVAPDDPTALAWANECELGLGGAVFTQQIEKIKSWAEINLQVGMVAINDSVKSDARLPFGGVRHSGYGRELGPQGLLEFVNIKTVSVGKKI